MNSLAIAVDETRLAGFCESHQIRRLAVFGSVLAGRARPDSDLDLLVEFEPEARVGLIKLAGIEQELTALVGRKVDLRSPADLSRYFRKSVVDTAQVLYERT